MSGDGDLTGLNILVVEDEGLVAMLIEDILSQFGSNIVGPAPRVPRALELLRSNAVDIALLDVNVAGEMVYPVAEELRARGIPFVFATGFGPNGLEEAWRGSSVVQKPFAAAQIASALRRAMAESRAARPT